MCIYNLFNPSPKHRSSRGSFIAHQSCIRHESAAGFSAAVHRTLFHKFRARDEQKFFSTHDEAAALKHCQFISDYIILYYIFPSTQLQVIEITATCFDFNQSSFRRAFEPFLVTICFCASGIPNAQKQVVTKKGSYARLNDD